MLTNNYKEWVKGYMTYHVLNGTAYYAPAISDFIDMNGAAFTKIGASSMWNDNGVSTINMRFSEMDSVRVSRSDPGVTFGNGTTAPSETDFRLSGDLITTIVTSSSISFVENNDGSVSRTALYTVTNTGTKDITIAEIGYTGRYCPTSSSYSAILLDHTLLDEPITIPAGGVGQVTYTINFNIA